MKRPACATDTANCGDPPSPERNFDLPVSNDQNRPPIWTEGNLRLAIEAAGVALWSWNVDNDTLIMDEPAYRLWGVPSPGS